MFLPANVPVLTHRDATLFPGVAYPLKIEDAFQIHLIRDVLEGGRVLVFTNNLGLPHQKTAGLGILRAAVKDEYGSYFIILQGLVRCTICKKISTSMSDYPVYHVVPVKETFGFRAKVRRLECELRRRVDQVLNQGKLEEVLHVLSVEKRKKKDAPGNMDSRVHFLNQIARIDNPGLLADIVASALFFSAEDRQAVMEKNVIQDRLTETIRILCKNYQIDPSSDSLFGNRF